MPRFVILAHDWPAPHFDLMLEAGGVLKSWRLLAVPVPGMAVPAEATDDHRLEYLDYEGPVSGGRGVVRRVDGGTFAGAVGETWELEWAGRGVARLEPAGGGGLVFVGA